MQTFSVDPEPCFINDIILIRSERVTGGDVGVWTRGGAETRPEGRIQIKGSGTRVELWRRLWSASVGAHLVFVLMVVFTA